MEANSSSTEYQERDRRGLSEHKVRHVNDHLTPLAAIIVVPGLLVANLPFRNAVVVAALITLSVVVNYTLFLFMTGNRARFVGNIRVASNYAVKVVLCWLLYAVWGPVWLLLLLMSIGVAIYQNRRDSLLAAVAFAIMLMAIHWNFGANTVFAWTEVGVEAAMIVLLNQYVNGLVKRPDPQDANQGQSTDPLQATNQV